MQELASQIIQWYALAIEFGKKNLIKSSLSLENGIYRIGEFEVLINESRPTSCSCIDSIEFWKVGEKKNKRVAIDTNGTLSLYTPFAKYVLSNDLGGLRIRKFVLRISERYDYYKYEFEWAGKITYGRPKNILFNVTVNVDNNLSIRYEYDKDSGEYKVSGLGDKNLSDLGLPENLNEVAHISGIPFHKEINFDEEMEGILKDSNIRKFLKTILENT